MDAGRWRGEEEKVGKQSCPSRNLYGETERREKAPTCPA